MKGKESKYNKETNPGGVSCLNRKAKFRYECLKRSKFFKIFSDIVRVIDERKISKGEVADLIFKYSEAFKDFLPFFLTYLWWSKNLKDGDDLAWYYLDIPSIKVVNDYSNPRTREAIASKYLNKSIENLNKEMKAYPTYRDLLFGWEPIVEEDKTISIKINLNRKKSEIINDVSGFLDILKKYGKYGSRDYRLPPGDFEKYFKAYDLRESGKLWREIADEIFPNDVDRKNAEKKVQYYHEEVKRYIQEEVWR